MNYKNLLFATFLSTMCLTSCNTEGSSSSLTSLSSNEETEVLSSSKEPTLYDLVDQEFEKDEQLFNIDKIELGVNETYNLSYMLKQQYLGSQCLIACETEGIIESIDSYNIKGLAIGESKVKVVSQGYYDELVISVKDDEYMKANFTTDLGRLANKSFAVFGSSSSDPSASAYEQRQYFWCEQIQDMANMTMYNHAKSGGIAGYIASKPNLMSISATTKINNSIVLKDIEKCDFAFLLLGGNDYTYKSEIGSCGDVNDENYQTKESFKGAYSYIIDKILATNPNTKIICLSITASTWEYGTIDNSKNHAKTRQELANITKDVANEKNVKFINLYDLWTTSSEDVNKYIPDGIHPLTIGHNLIREKIFNS